MIETMEAALREINRTLGANTAALDAIRRDVDGMRRDMAASEVKSDQSRANVHRRMDDLIDHVGEIEAANESALLRIGHVEAGMKDSVMPVVAKVTAWEQRGVGALFAAGIAGSALGALIASFWSEIVAKLTRTG